MNRRSALWALVASVPLLIGATVAASQISQRSCCPAGCCENCPPECCPPGCCDNCPSGCCSTTAK